MRRRHPDVDDRDVGSGELHATEQLVAPCPPCRRPRQPASASRRVEALAEERLVVGDHDAHGSSARIVVRAARRRVDVEPAVERADAVLERDEVETVAAGGLDLDRERGRRRASARTASVPFAARTRLGDDGVRRASRPTRSNRVAGRSPIRIGTRASSASASTAAREPVVGEHGREDAVRELAQLCDRGASSSLGRARAPATSGCCSRARRSDSDSADEPLLGAVVEVALEALPLGVARLDDPRSRRAQLLETCPHLGLQPLVLEREPRGRGHLLDELLVVEQAAARVRARPRPVRPGRGSSAPDPEPVRPGRPNASTSRSGRRAGRRARARDHRRSRRARRADRRAAATAPARRRAARPPNAGAAATHPAPARPRARLRRARRPRRARAAARACRSRRSHGRARRRTSPRPASGTRRRRRARAASRAVLRTALAATSTASANAQPRPR